jgi:formamidopyrimidine-DNA glycosylase
VPELPEVETTLRGIEPVLLGHVIQEFRVRNPALRWPVPAAVQRARGRLVLGLERRAKYMLIDCGNGGLLIHLGMSGSLRICDPRDPPRIHDHFDLVLGNGHCIRFHDPRRFGALLWWDSPWQEHPLLRQLGPEPLGEEFDGAYLHHRSRGLRVAVKQFIMDGKVVVGETFTRPRPFSCLEPSRAAGAWVPNDTRRWPLPSAMFWHAIRRGGTTLRDFLNSSGTGLLKSSGV